MGPKCNVYLSGASQRQGQTENKFITRAGVRKAGQEQAGSATENQSKKGAGKSCIEFETI